MNHNFFFSSLCMYALSGLFCKPDFFMEDLSACYHLLGHPGCVIFLRVYSASVHLWDRSISLLFVGVAL